MLRNEMFSARLGDGEGLGNRYGIQHSGLMWGVRGSHHSLTLLYGLYCAESFFQTVLPASGIFTTIIDLHSWRSASARFA